MLKTPCSIGFGVQWPPDRAAGSDNAIALLDFATKDAVMILRTHKSQRWLPQVVRDILSSTLIEKVSINSVVVKTKFFRSFGFEVNVVDINDVATARGIVCINFRSLMQQFKVPVRHEPGRIDWKAEDLPDEHQIHAAREVFDTLNVYRAMADMPVVNKPVDIHQDFTSSLSLQPGWADEGMVRRHDGLYCTKCEKGPILSSESVLSHLASKAHIKKLLPPEAAQERQPVVSWQPGWAEQGIVQKRDGLWCELCSKGPLASGDVVDAHLNSQKHLKKSGTPLLVTAATASEEETSSGESSVQCLVLRAMPAMHKGGLELREGDTLSLEAQDATGELFYGRDPSGRRGWFAAEHVEMLAALDSSFSSDDSISAKCCSAVCGPAEGFADENFLLLEVGETVQIEYVGQENTRDDGWLWCRKFDGTEGWIASLVLELSDLGRP